MAHLRVHCGDSFACFQGFAHELAIDHALVWSLLALLLIVGASPLKDPLVGLLSQCGLSTELGSEALQHQEKF